MKYYVTINDKRYEVDVEKGEAVIVGTTEAAPTVIEKAPVKPQTEAVQKAAQAPKQTLNAYSGKEIVKAPMAGAIVGIKAGIGSAVKKGDILLILEAMKMENEITAPQDGVVAEILVSKGAIVASGDALVVLG